MMCKSNKILIIPRAVAMLMRQAEHRGESSIAFLFFSSEDYLFSGFGIRAVIVQIVTLSGYIL